MLICDYVAGASVFTNRRIGDGAFGEIFVGTHLGVAVAVKRLRLRQLNSRARKEFEQECDMVCHSSSCLAFVLCSFLFVVGMQLEKQNNNPSVIFR